MTTATVRVTPEGVQFGKCWLSHEAIMPHGEITAGNYREWVAAALEGRDWPACPECKAGVLYECPACSASNYPPPQDDRAQPPVESGEALLALVAKWRSEAAAHASTARNKELAAWVRDGRAGSADAFSRSADELEAAIKGGRP